ncbi:MAG: hypothetical protein ACKO3P_16680 [Planctomycetaceae bacterium]
MEVSLRECPACHHMVMGVETHCPECQTELPPVIAPPAQPVVAAATRATGTAPKERRETPCPQCGIGIPPGVLRCRDCGAYVSAEVEAAAMARVATRMSQQPRTGFAPAAPGFNASAFATVAEDDDFDLSPEFAFKDDPLDDVPAIAPLVEDDGFEDDDSGSADGGYNIPGLTPIEPEPEAPPVKPAPKPAEPKAAGGKPAASKGTTSPADGGDDVIPLAPLEEPAPVAGKVSAPAAASSDPAELAGAALLSTAIEEAQESAARPKGTARRKIRGQTMASVPGRFLVYCPKGHRIQVQDKHRGRTGRCPNCKTLFFVPMAETSQAAGATGTGEPGAVPAEAGTSETPVASSYARFINDVSLIKVNPQKLKVKADSLVAEGLPADIGIAADHLLVAVLFVGSGPFRSMQEPKKKAANRTALQQHLASGRPLAELQLPAQHTLPRDLLAQIRIVQPAVPGEESLFADVPVFGTGRIAVRVPGLDSGNERAYLAFTLSQFRQFAEALAENFQLSGLGSGTAIPLSDEFDEHKCHYSETELKSIPAAVLPYYVADKSRTPVVIGHKCQGCGLVVSEDSRKKEKVGSKNPTSVAGAKCPKCKAKMGKGILMGFPQGPSMS